MSDSDKAQSDAENTVEYWRNQAETWRLKLEESRAELEEFTVGSRELELELEKELTGCQQQNGTLRNDLRVVSEENRAMKEQEQRQMRRIDALEDQVKQNNSQSQSNAQYRRELEQKNEELETTARNLSATLDNRVKEIEVLLEAKALLEGELETARAHREVEQRLRDELRDLKDEVAARSKEEGRAGVVPSREPRRTLEQSVSPSERDLDRLHSMAARGDYVNGHHHHLHKACLEREEELSNALAATASSKAVIQNLVLKISVLESEILSIRRSCLKNGPA